MKKIDIIKIKKIKLVISDIDGVLTDGGMYYSSTGEFLKKFNTKDSFGMELLLKSGIKTIFLTREKSIINEKRAEKIAIVDLYSGIKNKEDMIPKILKKYNVTLDEIAYIGDDLNDFQFMIQAGFSATPSDGVLDIKKISHYICKSSGGSGAFREFSDLILKYKLSNL